MASFKELKAAFNRFSSSSVIDVKDAVRIDFMTRLALDLPPYYPCFGCLRLHPWRNIELPRPYFNLPGCFERLLDGDRGLTRVFPMDFDQYPSYTQCQLHFVHLQLAMRRFYYGPQFGIPVESFFGSEVAIRPLGDGTLEDPRFTSLRPISNEELDNNNLVTTLTSIDARICPDPSPSLCVRTQELAVVRRQNVFQVIPNSSTVHMYICEHISTSLSNFGDILDSLLERYCSDSSVLSHVDDRGRCLKCNTSWKLELRDVGPRDVCFVVTKWMDLGPGLSPEDGRWKCHIGAGLYISLADDELVSDPQARFERDSVQAHEANALSDEEMFNRNISLLQRHEYRIIMTRCDTASPRWFMNAEWTRERRGTSRCVVM